MELEYKEAYKLESYGHQFLGLKVLIALHREITQDELSKVSHLANQFKDKIYYNNLLLDKKYMAGVQDAKDKILACFPGHIFVEDIPNGYGLNVPEPWYRVTTRIGHFVAGWRGRVINLDWSSTTCKKKGKDLFPDCKDTIGDNYIHAWTYEQLKTYVEKIHELA